MNDLVEQATSSWYNCHDVSAIVLQIGMNEWSGIMYFYGGRKREQRFYLLGERPPEAMEGASFTINGSSDWYVAGWADIYDAANPDFEHCHPWGAWFVMHHRPESEASTWVVEGKVMA